MRKIILLISFIFLGFSAILFVQAQQKAENSFVNSIIRRRNGFNLEKAKKTTVILTGDIMLGRTVMTTSLDKKNSIYPFEKVKDTLKDADIVFGNLENPIVSDCPRHTSGFKFCADPSLAEGLIAAGIDVLTIANNHTLNYGRTGFDETKRYLSEKGIESVGDGNLVIKVVNGLKFGFLGFDFVTKIPKEEDFTLVKESDGMVDILVVGVHWGQEYKDVAGSFQIQTAKKLVDLGADIISGHHPHWVQNIEYISEKPVYYSLGNFIFDQMWSEQTRKGLAIRLTFEDKKLVKEEKLPIYMKNWAQPEFVE